MQVFDSLQLSVNLPAAGTMVEPRTQDLVAADLPLRREQGAEISVFSGKSGDVIARAKNYSPVTMLEGHSASIWSAAFSPDGQRVVTASLDHTARVFRILTADDIDRLLASK